MSRRLNGERSKLQLLGLGLDRYEKGEEGIATMREGVLDNEMGDSVGMVSHLAISLAYGLDGVPRNFREVYEIMEKYLYLRALSSGGDSKKAFESVRNIA